MLWTLYLTCVWQSGCEQISWATEGLCVHSHDLCECHRKKTQHGGTKRFPPLLANICVCVCMCVYTQMCGSKWVSMCALFSKWEPALENSSLLGLAGSRRFNHTVKEKKDHAAIWLADTIHLSLSVLSVSTHHFTYLLVEACVSVWPRNDKRLSSGKYGSASYLKAATRVQWEACLKVLPPLPPPPPMWLGVRPVELHQCLMIQGEGNASLCVQSAGPVGHKAENRSGGDVLSEEKVTARGFTPCAASFWAKNKIFQQLSDELPWHLVQTFTVPKKNPADFAKCKMTDSSTTSQCVMLDLTVFKHVQTSLYCTYVCIATDGLKWKTVL